MARLTPDELVERADAIGRLGALEAHGFFGGHITKGHAVRVVFRKGRRFDDLVLFQQHEGGRSGVQAPPGGEFQVVAEWQFPIASEWGPVVVQDRLLPTTFANPVEWVNSAISGVELPGLAGDEAPNSLMDEERFWSLIDILGGMVNDEKVAKLSEALEELPITDLVSFRDSLVVHLHALDHPLNTVGSGLGQARVVSADASLYYRCELIAAGRSVYREHIEDPRFGEGAAGAYGEALIGIAENAAIVKIPDSKLSIETGTNPQHWPGAPATPGDASTTIPSPGPFSYDIQLSRLRLGPNLLRMYFVWVAYVTTGHGVVRELMGCVAQGSNAAAREEVSAHIRSLLRDGESLHPDIIVYRPGIGGVAIGGELSGVARRSKLGMDAYIQRYHVGGVPPTSGR